MDKKELLLPEVQSFIKEHEGDDLHHLMLQKSRYAHLPLGDIIEQIRGRKKAAKKLPTWYNTANILYPPAISIEQSSSEITAKYKTGLFSGTSALDLTGGFGVDSFYLAQRFKRLCYVEKNEDLAHIAQHNFTCLNQQNISTELQSAEDFLNNNNETFDLIYIDPDRRPGQKRVTGFKDSKPDLPGLLPKLVNKSTQILIKASPMMDISLGIKELSNVKMVIVLAVDNEVKELLFWLSSEADDVKIKCVNIGREYEHTLEYALTEEQQQYCLYGKVEKYLYEPNAAIMKAGAFNLLCKNYKLIKLHQNTHLYTSETLVEEFPGRKFLVKGDENYNKRKVLTWLTSFKANISVRNFPNTPEQVKKKLGLKDGGEQYLIGYRNNENDLRIAICEKA